MKYAIALDIGTTNVQALLIEVLSGRHIDYLSVINSQAIYGEDVITRMARSLKSDDIREKIRKYILEDITILIGLLLKRKNILPNSLEKIIVCGNSTMHHILLGLPLEGLARAPFRPAHKGKIYETSLGKLGITSGSAETPFIFLPNLGGFIGSDALCVILQTEMYESDNLTLAVDLGTNGEIMLGSKKRILAASTSAGPAFESWQIKCGIYGSALIDVMTKLLGDGTIDKSGFMKKGKLTLKVGRRDVEVTQKDVREFQLAKAAISAGIKILRRSFKGKSIKKVYITGVFGSKLNKANAKKMGVLPEDIKLDKVEIKEKSALLGAGSLLRHTNIDKDVEPITKKIEHVELHKAPDFQEVFTQSIHF